MDVRLPDGTIIRNVPEGTTRAQLMSKLRAGGYDVSGFEEPEERTFGGYAKEALKGLVPGAVGLGETAITGAAALLPDEAEEAIRRPVSEFAESVRERFAPAPGYEDTTVRKLSEAVGSTLPFLPLGALGAAGRIAATGLGVSAGAGEARQRAEEEEATEGERAVATALGAPVGALEALPPIRILRRLGFGDEAIEEVAGFAPALRRAAQAGGEEALQEASSQVLQNLIAKGVYAPDEEVFGGVGEAAATGGGAGAIVSAIADLALGRRLRGVESAPERREEEPAPPEAPSDSEIAPVQEARRLAMEQMELPLETEAVQMPLFEEEPAREPTPSLYRPAEEVMADLGLKPRSRAYKEEAKDLELKLDRKGDLKPNQFVFQQPETEVPLTQGRFEFETPQVQPDLPMTVPPTDGQLDMFGAPIPRGGEMQIVPSRPEMPVTQEIPKEQMALNLPGMPMERLAPRDRVLRAMAITEDKKNIPNLKFATQLRPMELQKAIGDLKKEGAIAFNNRVNEWELTPVGAERVRSGPEVKPARPRRGPALPVPPARPAEPTIAESGERGVAGVSTAPARVDVGTQQVQPALEAPPPVAAPVTAPIQVPTQAQAPAPAAPPVDRMALIRRAQEKRVARAAVDEVEGRRSRLRTQAIDAFDNDQIDERTYTQITEQLKRPVPNFGVVEKVLSGEVKPGRKGIKFQLSPTAQPAPTPHPEWAVKFEPDVGGQVVYSDEDTALVRGSSVLSGQNVYMAVDRKTGMRTNVDIDSFTGKLFTPEQKQRLTEAKKQVVARDTELFNQNPDGPFTGATSNVVRSEKVNPNYEKLLSNLMNSMGLGNVRVFLVHPEDVRNQADKYKLYGQYSSAMSAGLDAGEEGSLRVYGPNRKDFYISMKSGLSEVRTVEILGHEFGHLIERVAYNNAPAETKAAIRAEYDTWLKENKGRQGADLVRALRNRETAEAQTKNMAPDVKLRDSYWRSFSEWFADNTSKWVTTSEKPVGIVEQFFADLAKKLKELVAKLTGNRFVPPRAVKKFLDDMGPGSADSWLQDSTTADKSPFNDAARYSMTPTEQRSNDRAFVNAVGKISQSLPAATKETYEAARNAASNLPTGMRRVLYTLYDPHEMGRIYSKDLKSDVLEKLWKNANQEGTELRKMQDTIMDNMTKWGKVMEKYSEAEQNKIRDLFMATTTTKTKVQVVTAKGKVKEKEVFGVEVLDLVDPARNINWKADVDHPLYKQLSAIFNRDPALKGVYKGLRLAYVDNALAVEKQLQQYLTPAQWQKILSKLNEQRVRVYLPLFRQGNFKLSYTDRAGNPVALQFESSAERSAARQEILREGVDPNSIIESRVEDRRIQDIPPSSFLADIVGDMKEAGVNDDIVADVIEHYLDYLPTDSVLQRGRRRQEVTPAGYSNDVLKAYANVSDSYARRIVKMEFQPKYFELQEELKVATANARDRGVISSDVAEDLNYYATRYIDFVQNPNLSGIGAQLGYASFQLYLGANISTAVTNVIDTPTVLLSRLLGKGHKIGSIGNSLVKAGSIFFSKQKSPEMQELIQRGLDSGIIREQRLQDIAEFKNLSSRWEKLKANVDRITSWAFAKSDMFNREVGLIAAYDLQKAKNKTPPDVFDQAAFDVAQSVVADVYGSSFPKATAPIMGSDIAKTALTFKRFGIKRINLLQAAYKEATRDLDPNDPDSKVIRDAARKEIIGYFATAFVSAGVQGMPLVGAGAALVTVLNGILGDDDEPYDADFALREAVGLFAYKGPINYLFGIDIASRTGWTGMFWREDPKRMAEVGPITYAVEQALGPAYSYAVGLPRVAEYIEDGNYQRAFEQLMPRAVSNVSKGFRYATEGALTAKGVPLVEDVNAYNAFMQIFGFRPSDVAEAGDIAGATKRMESKIFQRRNAIIARAAVARMSGDVDGFRESVEEAVQFSRKYPSLGITYDTLYEAVQRRTKKLATSVNGVTVNPKVARGIYEELGVTDEVE